MGHTIYLAGPMTGYPDDNYPLFNETAARLRAWGWDVLNPAETFGGDRSRRLSEYMRADTEMLCRADGIALLDGWEQSEGARFEVLMAQKRGMPIYDARSMALINSSVPEVKTILATTEADVFTQALGMVQPGRACSCPVATAADILTAEAQAMGDDPDSDTRDQTGDWEDEIGPELPPTLLSDTPPFRESQAVSAKTTQRVMAALQRDTDAIKREETVLEEAQRLVYGDRQASYGHPYTDYLTTSRLWEAILELPEGTIGPLKAALMMALMKISRESRKHKRDNLVDAAGYAACAERIARRQAGEE